VQQIDIIASTLITPKVPASIRATRPRGGGVELIDVTQTGRCAEHGPRRVPHTARFYLRVFAATLLLFPGRFEGGFLPPLPPFSNFWPGPLLRPGSKSSVEDFVFCFDRRPALPKPNLPSLALRDILGRSISPEPLARFEGRSEMASSTATSKSSPSAWALSRAPFRSK